MPRLPVFEVVPPVHSIHAKVTIPGSKSITNRALVLAALANGATILEGALWSEDTQWMVDCLQKLGFQITVEPDPQESANRLMRVVGKGGEVPDGEFDLFVGNSGNTARFLAAMVARGRGRYRFSGSTRMHERPQGALFDALRQMGYRVEASNNRLPATIYGGGKREEVRCRVSISESSQFASALLLSGWQPEIDGENTEEISYVRMTSALMASFPKAGGRFLIEPDASSASYFWGAGWLLPESEIEIANWPNQSLQIDARFPEFLRPFRPVMSRRTDLGDSIMTAIVLAPLAETPKRFVDLGRLRVQESERVEALRTELGKCGVRVDEEGDSLTIYPSTVHGAEIEAYGDHRIAMCFGMLGLRVPGIRIKDPQVVEKTFPSFWEKFESLGVTLR